MDYKKIIYDFLDDDKYTKMTFDEIVTSLNVPNEDFTAFVKAYNELDNEGKIYQTNKGYIHLAYKMNIHKGVVFKILTYKILVKIEDDEIISINNDLIDYLYPQDIIYVSLNGDGTGNYISFIKHGNLSYVATYVDGKYLVDDKYFPYDLHVKQNKNEKLKNGDVVKIRVFQYKYEILYGKIEKKLGNIKDPSIDILKAIVNSGVRYEFDDKLLDYVNKSLKEKETSFVKELSTRKDLSNELIVTIDGLDAKDLDDAISVKISDDGYYLLGVHIADVSYYVDDNTILDKEAFSRGTSIYLTDRVIPMLPEAISNGVCSLNPGTIKLTMSCIMKIDYDGNVIDYEITPSYIKSKARLDYDDINHLFNNEKTTKTYSKELKEMLFLALRLSNIIKKKLINDGYVSLKTTEAKIILDENSKPIRIEKRRQLEAEHLIEYFMIMANTTVASAIYYMNLPFIYRVHPEIKKDKLSLLKDKLSFFNITLNTSGNFYTNKLLQSILKDVEGKDYEYLINDTILRSMSKAYYSIENIGHFGLGLQCYTHFTSPIRRYPDLVVARMLKKYLVNNDFTDKTDILLQDAENSSVLERKAIALEREVDDIKKAEYMQSFIGQIYEGIVSGISDFGVFVMLDNTCEGLIRNESFYENNCNIKYNIGDKITIRVASVNIPYGEINFDYVKIIRRRRYEKTNK